MSHEPPGGWIAERGRLLKLLDEAVREREDWNGMHQVAVMKLDQARMVLRMLRYKLVTYQCASQLGELLRQIDEVLND